MSDIILLAHRVPWPPDKGDKIRSWNLLRHLASRHTVYLGAFADQPEDLQHADHLRSVCKDVLLLPLTAQRKRMRALRALSAGQAVSISVYDDPALHAWVRRIVERLPHSLLFAYSGQMAQYGQNDAGRQRRVVDMVDVDSDKWRQYGLRQSGPMGWLYRREARLLGEYEKRVACDFDACLFVSRAEADVFRSLTGLETAGVNWYANGVDNDYFNPWQPYSNPYPSSVRPLVFTGAMDYWPNADAACWFAQRVLPAIQLACPGAAFYIVGSRPSPQVQELTQLPGVHVTGRVEDVRPWLAHAALAVAPLRVARGVQNKVLEAMAMARPVLASPEALDGIEAQPGTHLLLADGEEDFAKAALSVLSQRHFEEHEHTRRLARAFVLEHHHWPNTLARLDSFVAPLLAEAAAPSSPAWAAQHPAQPRESGVNHAAG